MPIKNNLRPYSSYVDEKIERLTILAYEKRLPSSGAPAQTWFQVQCECGSPTQWRLASQIVSRSTKSCGCLRSESSRERLHARRVAHREVV